MTRLRRIASCFTLPCITIAASAPFILILSVAQPQEAAGPGSPQATPHRVGDSYVPGWPKELPVPYSGPYRAKVVEVHDGDTCTLECSLGFNVRVEVQVRLYGINAAELSTPAGKVARDHLASLIPPGTPVRLTILLSTTGEQTQSFTRYVGSVEFVGPAGKVVTAESAMVAAGQATWCDRNLRPLNGPPVPISRWVEAGK